MIFYRITSSKLSKKESVKFEAEVPNIIAESARGSARDSMSILEQCISYGNENLTTDKISHLLGIIDEKVINEIVMQSFSQTIR